MTKEGCSWNYCTLCFKFLVMLNEHAKKKKQAQRKKGRKKSKLICFHSHFSASCRSPGACGRKRAERRGVCVWEKMTIKEQRALVLSVCVGQWKSWKLTTASPSPTLTQQHKSQRAITNTHLRKKGGKQMIEQWFFFFCTNHIIKRL